MRTLNYLSTLIVGITTLVGGGTGPAHGTCATTCTPAPSQMKLMLQSTDQLPINMGFTGKVYMLYVININYVAVQYFISTKSDFIFIPTLLVVK